MDKEYETPNEENINFQEIKRLLENKDVEGVKAFIEMLDEEEQREAMQFLKNLVPETLSTEEANPFLAEKEE